ncbi:MAG: hypothetical protein D6706_13410 [Chloroflexi bacterium]|nr:MAG: hypothetical protein D6706_13410 [Chloroflexota bacterium]
MVGCQVGEETIFTVATKYTGLDNTHCGEINLCPADAIYCAAARVTCNGHCGPAVTIPVFKVLWAPVIGLYVATARLGDIHGEASCDASRCVQINGGHGRKRVGTKRICPCPNGVIGAVVASFANEIVWATGWPCALIPSMQV